MRPLIAPLMVELEVTTRCNQECIHCRLQETPTPFEMTADEIKAIIDQLTEMKVLALILTGGEPFLRKDILEIIRYADETGIQDISVITNGSLLTSQKVGQLNEIEHFKGLQISLDGASPETNDNIRGRQSFETVVQALNICSHAKFKKCIETVVMKPNLHELPEIIKLAINLGADMCGAFRFFPMGRGSQHQRALEVTPQELRKFFENFYNLKLKYKDKIVMLSEDPLITLIEGPMEPRNCGASWYFCAISAEGHVKPCIALPISAGNIKETPLKVIWREAELFQKLRDLRNLKGKCGRCDNKEFCGGCRAYAYHIYGDIFGEDPLCWS